MRPSDLDPDRWREIDRVLDEALDLPEPARDDYLAGRCDGDPELRAAVDALLAEDGRSDGPLDRPIDDLGIPLPEVDETPDLEVGAEVGRFRIDAEVGRGGMGVVYRAVDTRLARTVALKVLRASAGTESDADDRLLLEARAVSALDHPNVATLHEIGTTPDGHAYMVFAHYDGETLDARIARGRLPADEALRIARGIAAGLDAAHRGGVIHRDVKPSNVLLVADGGVKLLDFGVARIVGQPPGRVAAYGTSAYMSPEQAQGEEARPASDLWSLGVVLHEMLTGRRPSADVRTDASPEGGRPRPMPDPAPTSEAVDEVVARLLAPDPDERFASAADVLEALDGVRAEYGERRGAAAAVRSPAARTATLLGGVALVLLVVAVATRSPSTETPTIERVAVLPLVASPGEAPAPYLMEGIRSGLVAELGALGVAEVIPVIATPQLPFTEMTAAELVRRLGVDAVVEGALGVVGDSMVLEARMTRSDGALVWTATERRPAGEVAVLGPAVAAAAAREVAGQARRSTTRAGPMTGVDPVAYDAYLRGVFNLDRRNQAGFALAERFLLAAIAADSSFAPAYAALAEAYGSAAFFGLRPPAQVLPRVRELVDRALALDSSLPEALVTRAAVLLMGDGDWAGSEASSRRALEANPSYAEAWRMLSESLAVQRRFDEALEAVERASRIERGTQFSAFRPGVTRYYMRDFEGAAAVAREGLEFFPDFWQGHWLLCLAETGRGRNAQALPACVRSVDVSGRTPMALAAWGYAAAMAGDSLTARQVLAELEARSGTEYVAGSFPAMVHAALGEADAAFEWLTVAERQKDLTLIHLRSHPHYGALYTDPRFAGLATRVGIPATPG